MTNNFSSVITSDTFQSAKYTGNFTTRSSFATSLLILMTHYYRVQLHLKRGQILYHLGQYDAALQDFRAALRLNWRSETAMSWIDQARRAGKRSELPSIAPRKDYSSDVEAHCLVAAKAITSFL